MIPGLHINTIAEFMYHIGISGMSGVLILYIIYAIASALDGVYAISLCIPDGATGILPTASQRMSSEGKVGKAIYSYMTGGMLGVLFAMAMLPVLFILLPFIQPFVQQNMFLILIFAVSYVLLHNFRPVDLAVFLVAGIFGLYVLSGENLIFPMFLGFFTLPMLMLKVKHVDIEENYATKIMPKIPFIASFATAIMYLVPGIATPSQIIILAGLFSSIKEEDFITALGAINASNIIYSITMLDIIGKARTGVAIVSEDMYSATLIEHVFIAVCGAIIFIVSAYIIRNNIKQVAEFFKTFNNPVMRLILGVYLIMLVYIINGGLLVAGVATLLGTVTILLNAKRTNLMGSIILNVLKYYYR